METSVNNKCRAFTSLEQSKKLAEILPLESADMFWYRDAVTKEVNPRIMNYKQVPELQSMYYSPCWSLASLLSILPEIQGGKPIIALDDNYITYPHISDLHTKADSLIDACVTMIIKLSEHKML